jgi:hypothetical protein
MADNPSNIPGAPQGAEPMKKSTGKVQPKKETVRINLPPKPSAAPTIKLPTLPPSGSTMPSMAPSAAPAAPRATTAPSIQRPAAAPQQQMRPAAPVAAPVVKALSPLDTGLAIAAAVVGLIAVGTTAYMAFMF